MKILVTGDRKWVDAKIMRVVLKSYVDIHTKSAIILVHGNAPGADQLAAFIAKSFGITDIRPYAAHWNEYNKAAGPLRNQEMLDKEHKPNEPIDLVLAFHNDITNSKGTKDMLLRAGNAGIATRLITGNTYAPF